MDCWSLGGADHKDKRMRHGHGCCSRCRAPGAVLTSFESDPTHAHEPPAEQVGNSPHSPSEDAGEGGPAQNESSMLPEAAEQ